MNEELREKLLAIITYHSDEGTSGYLLSEKKINDLLALIHSETNAALGRVLGKVKEMELALDKEDGKRLDGMIKEKLGVYGGCGYGQVWMLDKVKEVIKEEME